MEDKMSESEEDGIEILCPVCSQPMDVSEEVAECANPMCNVYELETGTWYTISRHIESLKNSIAELEAIQLDHALATQYLTQLLQSHTRVIPAETLAGLCSQIDNLLMGVHVKLPDWTGVIETPTSANPGAMTKPGGMDDGVYRVDGGPAETGEPGTAHFERGVECPFCAQVIYVTIGTIPAHKTSMRADCAAVGMTIADAKYQAKFLPTMDDTQ